MKTDILSDIDFISELILVACGDFRLLAFVRKYLKRMHGLKEMDIASTAGGSRTLSFYGAEAEELEIFKIKQTALFIDFEKYLHHGAKKCVIACHNLCAFWPKFANPEEEFKAHFKSLIQAGKIIKEKYPEIEEVILLYVILDEKTRRPKEVIEIELSGEFEKIVVKDEPRLAQKTR